MNVYVSVCIILCFYQESVNKRQKRIWNHLKVIVSFYKKCIIPYKNHNTHNRFQDNLNKGRLEFWKKPLSTLSNKKFGTKVKNFFRGKGNFTQQIWVRFWACTSLFWTKMTKLIWQRYKNLFNIILVWYGSRSARWMVKNRIESSFVVAFVTFYKINIKWGNSFMYKVWFELPFILFYRFDFYKWDIKGRHRDGCCEIWSCLNFNLKHAKKKRKYVTFTREEILNIGKYASIHGNSCPARKYSIGESTVRLHWKKYEQGPTSSTKVKLGRPLLLGSEISGKVIKYLHAIWKKGGVVSTVKAVAIAQALITKSEDKNPKVLDLERTAWTKSLFHRMGFVKRSTTSGKPVLSFLVEQREKLASYIIIKSLSLRKNMTCHHL